MLELYMIIGPFIGIMGIYILNRVEPIERPGDFGEFMLNCLMIFIVWSFMSVFWPITLIVGILYFVYQYIYEDAFRTTKAKENI